MKKLSIIAALGLCVLGGGYFFVNYTENKIENEILAVFKQENIHSESIDYNLFEDTTTLTGLKYKLDDKDLKFTIAIDSLSLTGLDMKALDNANTAMPKVFSNLTVSNLEMKSDLPDIFTTINIDSISCGEYFHDLAKLEAILLSPQNSPESIEAFLSYKLTDLFIKNIHIVGDYKDYEYKSSFSLAEFNYPGVNTVEKHAGSLKDFNIDLNSQIKINTKSIEFDKEAPNTLALQADIWSTTFKLVAYSQKSFNTAMSPVEEADMLALIESITEKTQEFMRTALKDQQDISNMTITLEDKEISDKALNFTIASINQKSMAEPQYSYNLAMNDLHFPAIIWEDAPEQFKPILNYHAPKGLNFSTHIKLNPATNPELEYSEYQFEVQDSTWNIQCEAYYEEDPSVTYSDEVEKTLASTYIKSIKQTYTDSGLIAFLLDIIATDEGQKATDFIAMGKLFAPNVIGSLAQAIPALQSQQENMIIASQNILEAPASLTFNVEFTNPTDLLSIMWQGTQMNANITVNSTKGEKSLVEQLYKK